MITSAQPYFPKAVRKRIERRISRVLDSKRFIMGPEARAFEEAFGRMVGVRYAVSVNSCTTALEMALRFLELKGSEVLVPTNTFVATANAVVYAGGTPVFVEIEPENLWISFRDLKRKLNSRTKALVLVHLGGIVQPEASAIIRWAKEKGLSVIEDCAHTVPNPFHKEKQAGSLGLAGAFSFWPTKILTTGTGGMLTTSSGPLAEYARSVRYHGLVNGNLRKIAHFGNDWAMNEIVACLGNEQLASIPEILKKRSRAVAWYREALSSLDGVRVPRVFEGERESFYKFWVVFEKPVNVFKLNKLMNQKFNVQTEFLYWPPVPLMPLYQKMKSYPWRNYPESDRALRNHLCLPLHTGISRSEVAKVVRHLKKALGKL